MYSIRKFFESEKNLKKNPLYTIQNNNTLKAKADSLIIKLVKYYSKKILLNNNKYLLKEFDKNYLLLFVSYYMRSKIYYKVCDSVINKYLNKKKNYKIFVHFDFVDFIYVSKVLLKLIRFFILRFSFFKKKIKFENCDILIEYLNGNSLNRSDFPILNAIVKKNKNIKIKYILSHQLPANSSHDLKKLKNNHITRNNIKVLKSKNFKFEQISYKTKRAMFFCLKNYFSHPLSNSIFLDFLMIYEYYYQLIKCLKIKLYINSNFDPNLPPIRQALKEFKSKCIGFQSSYVGSLTNSYLLANNDIFFAWGKNSEIYYNKKDNYIEKILKVNPTHLKYKRKVHKYKNKNKIITIFDSSFKKNDFISPEDYNKFLKIIIDEINQRKNIILYIKHKYYGFNKFINTENQLCIDKLKSQKKFKSFFANEVSNTKLIEKSDLVISINTLSIAVESLLNSKESLTFCNLSIDKKLLKIVNKIHPFAYNNISDFENKLNLKLNFKKKNIKLKKLKKYFFEESERKINPTKYICDFVNDAQLKQ